MDDIEFYREMAHRLLEENRQFEDMIEMYEKKRGDIQPDSKEEAEYWRTLWLSTSDQIVHDRRELHDVKKELNTWRSKFDTAFLKLDRVEKERLHWRSQCNMARKELSEVKAELAACKNRSCQTGDVVGDYDDANEITIDLDDGSRLVIIRETD